MHALFRTLGILLICFPAAPLRAAEPPSQGTEYVETVEVEVRGLSETLEQNVRRFLSIAPSEDKPSLLERLDPRKNDDTPKLSVAEVRRRHAAAPGQIRRALMPYGYYLPKIESRLTPIEGGFLARYDVDRGPPALLRNVTVRVEGPGSDFPALRSALEEVRLKAGDRLRHRRYEAAKSLLYDTAYNNGYLGASWLASEIRVLPGRQRADVVLRLDTGPRYRFGEVTVQQDLLNPRFVSRFVDIEPGEVYDLRRLLRLQRTLSDTGYFSRVEISAEPEAADAESRIPVVVRTEPARPQRYTVGLGYGTDTGPRAKLGALWRRVNGWGHQLTADLQYSAIESAIALGYQVPIRDVSTDRLSFGISARQEEVGDAETEQYALSASQLVNWLGFRRRIYLQAQREQFDFGPGTQRQTDLVYPGITLSRERVDNPQYATRGYSLRADLQAGLEVLLSDLSYTRLEVAARWVRAVAPDTRLLVRAEAGWLWTDDFPDLPPTQRFFAGGDRSVRGYGYQQIGPRNAEDAVIGGERMLAGSVEIERVFFGNYGAAAFVDTGDAFQDTPDLKVGAGLGLRWRSPIGMVRLDLAHPFDHDDNVRIHLSIGADL